MNLSRKSFLGGSLAVFAASRVKAADPDPNGKIFGLDEKGSGKISSRKWQPFSDRKVRVGIAGEGVCSFGSAFGFQNHPNVEVVACTDIVPEKCKLLQERVKAKKTYPS